MTTAAPGLPQPLPLLQADAGWRRIDLLSDVHLCEQMPGTFDAWARQLLHTPADALLMLGDVFELWVGDDDRHHGVSARALAVLRQAARRRPMFWMPGNRDFLLGHDMLADAGLQALADPTLLCAFGQRWLLSHGDALCLADAAYLRFRQQVRDAGWQQRFLAQPLALRQQQAAEMRQASRQHQQALRAEAPGGAMGEAGAMDGLGDVDDAAAAAWLRQAGAAVLIHGHTHRPGEHDLGQGLRRLVLGDWDLDAEPAQRRARCLRLDADGAHPLDLAALGQPA